MTAATTTKANLTAGPGNKKDQAKFAALTPAQQAQAKELANVLYDGTRTVAKCWAEAIAQVSPAPAAKAPAKAAPKVKAEPKAKAEAEATTGQQHRDQLAAEHAPAPEGYENKWPKVAFDLLKRVAGDGPAWLVRCNAHGATTAAENGKAGDALGTKAARPTWCKGCKADAAKDAKAEARAAAKLAEDVAKAEEAVTDAEAKVAVAGADAEALAE